MVFNNDLIKTEINNSTRRTLDVLAENLKYLRSKKKVSRNKLIYELSKYYGIRISYNNLIQIEWNRQKENIEIRTIAVFAKYFGKDISELLFVDIQLYDELQSERR